MARVQFDHVYKSFNKVQVVQDINMDIKDKEFLVLVGPSGCGKSTCLRMVAGLEDITSGEILIGDRVVNNVDPKDRDIAMVFQNYALYPHMSVYDNMAFGLKLRVFLLDEPLSNLDAKLRVQTRAEISKIHQRVQTTFIYVTHDQVEAMTMGSRIAVLNAGIVQQIGPPQELYDHPANLFVAGFIGSPAMNFFDNVSIAADGDSTRVIIGEIGQVEMPPLYAQTARDAADKKLVLGIRPEHFSDFALVREDRRTGSTLHAPIDVVEHLGSELLLYMTAMGKQVVARVDPRSGAHIGQDITLQIDADQIHLFNAETGEVLF